MPMNRRYASQPKRSLPDSAMRPLSVSSLRPRLRTVSIIPGIENLAPERTETSSGLAGSPKPLPVRSLDLACTASSMSSHRPVRQLLAVGEVVVAGLGGDREAGRGRQAGERHLGEARALAAEQVLHRAVAFGGARAPGVDVALGGDVRTVGGCCGSGPSWAGSLAGRRARSAAARGRIAGIGVELYAAPLRAPGLRAGCDGPREPACRSPCAAARAAGHAPRATLGRVRRRARSTGSAGRTRRPDHAHRSATA